MNQTLKLDPQTLMIASFSDVPSERISMSSATNQQVRQLQAKISAPVVNSRAPLTVVRRTQADGTLQYRVQFIAPTQAQDPGYQTTSVFLQTPNGVVRLQAQSGKGPIIFNSAPSSSPTAVTLQQNNTNGASKIALGEGNSRALVGL